jgi:diacylglycerol kinase (ATP)
MRVIVLHNPTAGETDLSRDDLVEALRAAGHDPVYHVLRNGPLPRGLQEAGDLLLAAGGDGTVRRVALDVAGSGTPVGVVPLGTANNIARALGIPNDPRDAIRGLSSARAMAFDVGTVRSAWGTSRFLEGLGFGLFAEMMAVSQNHGAEIARVLGAEAEIERDLRLLKALLPLHRATPTRLELDGEAISVELLLLEVMNIASVGPALRLAPDARPGDGTLDVIMADESRRPQLAAYLEERLAGDGDAVPDLVRRKARCVRLECTAPLVHLDDQRWPPADDERDPDERLVFDIGVQRRACTFLVPP